MDALNNNPLFNAGGVASLFSYFGINITNLVKLTNVNMIVVISIGVISILFTIMKMYHQWLITRRLKKTIREEAEKVAKEAVEKIILAKKD